MPELKKVWMPELDGLRAIAALSVLLWHYNPISRWDYGLARFLQFFPIGPMGVVFFFVLSSFLLTRLSVTEFDQHGRIDIIHFYVRRCLRIWPLYFSLLPCMFVVAAETASPSQLVWIRHHAWMWPSFLSNWGLALTPVTSYQDQISLVLVIFWSLSIEEQFYLLFPVVLSMVLTSTRRVWRVLAMAAVLGVVCRAISLLVPRLHPSGMYFATFCYADVFLAGCIAGWMAARSVPSVLAVHRTLTGALLGASVVVLSFLWRKTLEYPYASYGVVLYGVTACFFAVGILWVAANNGSILSRLLRSRSLRTLGVLTYGIYLWHPAIGALMLGLAGIARGDRLTAYLIARTGFVLYVAMTIGMAALTYLVVERPGLALKKRWYPSPTATARNEQSSITVWAR
ncbi:MAG TPA: acyltransferase [bacterium]|nr:acyltransferase [bacterium]